MSKEACRNMEIINLKKGESINLSKSPLIDLSKGTSLNHVYVGLGWDPINKNSGIKKILGALFGGSSIDCDAFAIGLLNNKVYDEDDVVYYGNLQNYDETIVHQGDNLTGEGEGDDEVIKIDLTISKYDSILIGVNIYNGVNKGQDFSQIQNAYIRLVDEDTGKELCKYLLDDRYVGYVTVIFGELHREKGDWMFTAKGEGNKCESIHDVIYHYQYQ